MDKDKVLQVVKKPKRTDVAPVVDLPEGDNNKYTSMALELMKMPKIDNTNAEQVQTRIIDYFQLCANYDMKPTISGLGLCIGLDRRRLWEIKNDVEGWNKNIPNDVRDIIKTTYVSMEQLWESYMVNGKINPVSGIFLGKNNFGYKDVQDHVITPNTTTTIDVKTIENKYDELPE